MSRLPRVVRSWLSFVLLLVSVPYASRAEKPQVWQRLRSPNFIVVTNASEKQARRVAYQFEMIRAVFRRVFGLKSEGTDPPVIILAAKDEATLMPLLPEAYQAKGSMHPAGFYQGGPEKNYVALRLDVTLNQEASEPYEPVYHEYVHYLTRRSISVMPLWLTEGLAEFYGNVRLDGKTVYVGAPSDSNLIVLHHEALLPLAVLFAVNASSAYYHENNKASIFYAESWALTHYLVTRDWREHTQRLNQFVGLLGQNVPAEEAAKQTLGDPAALDPALREYIGRFAFTAGKLEAPSGISADTYALEPISDAEALALRADLMVHTRRYAQAKQMLEEALKSDPKLAAADESMGLLYAEQQQNDEATKWFAQAVALNSQSYLANYYYASSLLKGRLDDDLAARAEASLRTAIKINPGFAPSYEALAFLLQRHQSGLEEARMLLLQAASLEPGSVHYRLQMVSVLERMNRADDAVRVATIAATMAKTPEEQMLAQTALDNAQRFQEYQRRAQEEQSTFRKTQAETTGSTQDEPGGSQTGAAPREAAGTEPSSETSPPMIRRRERALASEPTGPAPEAEPHVPPPKPALLSRLDTIDGRITASQCSEGARLDLVVEAPAVTRYLYSYNYFKIPYKALNYTPKGALNPCSDMKGMRSHIIYHLEKDSADRGELVEVQLIK